MLNDLDKSQRQKAAEPIFEPRSSAPKYSTFIKPYLRAASHTQKCKVAKKSKNLRDKPATSLTLGRMRDP